MPDGPRALKPDEFESLLELVNAIFYTGRGWPPVMGDDYLLLFNPDNFHNLRVIREDDRIVAHVGTTIQDASILGCHVRVGNIGGVCCEPSLRNRGFAGACFDDACANALSQGVDFLLISGDRSLYRRAGCRRVGLDAEFTVTPEAAAMLKCRGVTHERYRDEHLEAMKRLYENEPVRYLRPREHWQRFIRNASSAQHHSDLWIVRRGSAIVAYCALEPSEPGESSALEEYAGDRTALLGALDGLMAQQQLKALAIHTQPHDIALNALLTGCPLQPRSAHASGTQLILNFPQFMHRLHPLMEERAGALEASRLSFREYNGTFVFAYDGDTFIATSRGGAAQVVWGTYEKHEWQWMREGRGKDVLSRIFPIPALWYGFSYV